MISPPPADRPTTGFELDSESPLLSDLLDRASARGSYLIARAQSRRSLGIVVNNGRTEEIYSTSGSGIGLHVFTSEGHSALGSIDGFSPDQVFSLLDRTFLASRSAAAIGAVPNLGFLTAVPTLGRRPGAGRATIESVSLPEMERQALGLNGAARSLVGGLFVRTGMTCEREEWRVVRSDGTDVAWVVTRFIAAHGFTAEGAGSAFSCRAGVTSPHYDELSDSEALSRLDLRARAAAEKAAALPRAERFPSAGAVPILVDYALAKGLAHEAFGHAAEADSFRSSVLAREGRFLAGERVGRDGVSVIDEPIRGDHADQPFSANGEPRRRVEIVRSGLLAEALTDMFSAREARLESKGCTRAESFRSPPIPRMTNIRIEMAEARPLPCPFEEMTPAAVRDLLGDAGVLDRHPRVIYLSGYSGGQVNPVAGDFIFNCQALFVLTPDGVTIHRPSTFRGSILAALGSLSTGFGPLCLDAVGTCGKWGQSVPSCGGSHGLVFIEPDPAIGVGA